MVNTSLESLVEKIKKEGSSQGWTGGLFIQHSEGGSKTAKQE